MGLASAARILLAAAEPAAVEDVRQLLELAGHAVDWQPLDAFEADNGNKYDLIVLDGGQRNLAWVV